MTDKPDTATSVVVAMSGGVDSSTAAALLAHDPGYAPRGVTCLFSDRPAVPGSEALERARKVASQLTIEHDTIDARNDFLERVVLPFAAAYANGRTPNPCILCNPTMKFQALFDYADAHGLEKIATGHYAHLTTDEQGRTRLAAAHDNRKDQSYFLYRIAPDRLARLLFPLADLQKDEVRHIAQGYGLVSAKTAESQDICFIDEQGYAPVVRRYRPDAFSPGPIVDIHGTVLGKHHGIARYTVGQRQGLGIAAPSPLYVLRVDAKSDTIVVGTSEELLVTSMCAHDIVMHEDLPAAGCEVEVKIRHGMKPVPAFIRKVSDTLECEFMTPIMATAPGQSLVAYREGIVVGGGTVS